MQVVLNVKGSSRTTGSGHNREVVTLYRWPLVQVPPYTIGRGFNCENLNNCELRVFFTFSITVKHKLKLAPNQQSIPQAVNTIIIKFTL